MESCAAHQRQLASRRWLRAARALRARHAGALRRPRDQVVACLWLLLPGSASLVLAAEPAAVPPAASAVAAAAVRAEVLLVDVVVNRQALKDVVLIERRPGGPWLMSADTWAQARLVPLEQTFAMQDGARAHAIDAIDGVRMQLDRQQLRLEIEAPAAAFVGSGIGPGQRQGLQPTLPAPGVMLNYDLAATHVGSATSVGSTLELVGFGPFGHVVSSALVRDEGNGRLRAQRLDTYWRHDLPQRMETVVLGDTVGTSGGWSRPVRYAGLRWGRDFGMQPGFVTAPQFGLSGNAALPSVVEVLVDNNRRFSDRVPPGPFELRNLPLASGAGEVALVVRDLLGRETIVRQAYYVAPQLLAPGLHDFSFEAGRLRTGYGDRERYGDGFTAASWRQGLHPRLTGEARLELQRVRKAAGVEFAGVVGTWGAARLALAASTSSAAGRHERGELLRLGLQRSTRAGGASLQYEHASRGFAPFGEEADAVTRARRARERWLLSLGGPLAGQASAGLSYVRQSRWDGETVQLLGLTLGFALPGNASANVAVNRRLERDRSWVATVSLSMPLEAGMRVSSRLETASDGSRQATLSASRAAAGDAGLGWRLQAGDNPAQLQGGLQYHAARSEWTLDAVLRADGDPALRAVGRGTLGWVDGGLFASRPVGSGSVALVRVDGAPGLTIRRSYQAAATTDALGRAFVPGLVPWRANLIEIDPEELPLDVVVPSMSTSVVPYPRSAVVVDFRSRRSRQALLVARQGDGAPVPAGAVARLLPSGQEFVFGRRGEVWLMDLPERMQTAELRWPGAGCRLELVVPELVDGMPGTIGPLTCARAAP